MGRGLSQEARSTGFAPSWGVMGGSELLLGVLLGLACILTCAGWYRGGESRVPCPVCGTSLRSISPGRRRCEGCGLIFHKVSGTVRVPARPARL